MKSVVNVSKDILIKKIDLFLQSKEFSNLSEKEIQYIANTLLIDKLKDELKTEITKQNLNISELRNKWLSIFSSSFTRNSYSQSIDVFFKWFQNRNIENSIITLKAVDVDDYISWLNSQNFTNNTIQLRIAAISSFITYLQRIDILDKNYFKGCNGRPKRILEVKTFNDIPSDIDIQIIEDELWKEYHSSSGSGYRNKIISARTGIAVILLIKHHALRIRGLQSLEVDASGNFKTISKRSNVYGHLHEEVIKIFKELNFNQKRPFKDYRTETLQLWFRRYCLRLMDTNKIKTVYSFHDIRHYSAIKHWQTHHDIYKLKQFLNHKSITTTQVYLSSLNLEENNGFFF